MDLEIRRRESTGSGSNTHVETETLAKFELMDGAPVRGTLTFLYFRIRIYKKESIPMKIAVSYYFFISSSCLYSGGKLDTVFPT